MGNPQTLAEPNRAEMVMPDVPSWLEGLPSHARPPLQKRQRRDEDMAERHNSPSKRQRRDNEHGDEDDALSIRTLPVSHRPPSLSTQSGREASTPTTSNSRRARSPTKKVADLGFFVRPVTYRLLGEQVRLPPSINGLVSAINDVRVGWGIFPANIKVAYSSTRPPWCLTVA